MNLYASLDAVKRALRISSTAHDAYLLEVLEGASRAVDNYCRRHFYTLQEEPLEDPVNRLSKRVFDLAIAVPVIGLYYLYINRDEILAAKVKPLLGTTFGRGRWMGAVALALMGHDPGVAGHVRDGIIARDEGMMGELLVDFFTNIGETLEILASVLDAVLRLAPALFVLRDASCLFEERSQLFGLGLDETRDHALLDDGVPVRTDAGAEQDVRDVLATAARVVEKVLGGAVPRNDAAHGDFVVAGKGARDSAVRVIERKFHTRHTHGFAIARPVEDDIDHRVAAQRLGRGFAEHPANRVDDVRFAATVRADNAHQIAWKLDGRGIHERLEARELDLGQAQWISPWWSSKARPQ